MKAREIMAVSITLSASIDAVFVQNGDEWNGLREYRCISPSAFAGQKVITSAFASEGPFVNFFGDMFGHIREQQIVMASPEIGAAIKAISASGV